ncbi:MAG TPA: lytic transglycosylase domain-containing protein [Bryobacteraceae bacterium]|nr:lytic transglycosylase domain-containing protein [Bryobacteraceae bacterium]
MRILHLIGTGTLALLAAAPVSAGEYAVLSNGFRVHADRHETDGSLVRLYSDGGFTQMPAANISRFEQDDLATPPPAAPLEPTQAAPAPHLIAVPTDLAADAARKYSLPESFVRSVMKVESGFHPEALSPKGAIGLMQLMPQTARELGVDPKDPAQNADGGAQYLRDLLAKYEDSPDQVLLALAAYNAGPAAVEKYHGVPPYRETREYILRVLRNWDRAPKAD